MQVNYSSCEWFALAHAGWAPRVMGRSGNNATVRFAGPGGCTEERLVPIERLGKGLKDSLESRFPRVFHRPTMRVSFR